MKVFFASSTAELFKYFPIYKSICDTTQKLGHELTRDWLDEAYKVQKDDLKVDFNKMYSDILSSIIKADVGIVEGTVKGLTTGHQMTLALQKRKPLLYLHQSSDKDKFPFIVDEYSSQLLNEHTYKNAEELPQIIEDFLNMYKQGKKARFNLVLSFQEDKYIEWASFTHNKSKTLLIRELIQEKMKNDSQYKRN